MSSLPKTKNMITKTYAVVRFDDDTVSEVPSKWLCENNTMCWWPTSAKNASSYIARNYEPSENWTKYSVEAELFCDTLETARKKADDINYSETEEKGRGKRNKIKKKFVDYEVSSEEDNSRRHLEKAPQIPETMYVSDNGFLVLSQGSQDDPLKLATLGDGSDNYVGHNDNNLLVRNNDTPSLPDEVRAEMNDSNYREPQEEHIVTSNLSTKYDKNMLTRIINGIAEIQLQLAEIRKIIIKNDGIQDSFEEIRQKLPIKFIEDLENMTEYLSDEGRRALFAKYVRQIGGASLKDNLSRVYKNIFSNVFAVKCSWLGLKGNFRVSNTPVVCLIKEVVLELYPHSQQKEFETISSEWFRHARQRLQREK